jgi:poly(A) polymerase
MGINILVVGGYVRDLLLGYESNDIDFMVIGNALDFAAEFKRRYKTSALVSYPKFGTCMLYYNRYKMEFVTAREESYSIGSRKPKVIKSDLISDLSRRDFTINAMAMKINIDNFGEIFDPYNGREDLKNKIIRTPKEPVQTFSDDPLRMIRAIRFASQLSFEIEKQTYSSIRETANRLKIISQERITEEFNKILITNKPSIGLILLDNCDLLPKFLPELSNMKGVEQRKEYHHKDVFYHTLQVLDQVAKTSSKLELRIAALLHDIAKPRTKRFDEKLGWTFHGHEIVGERMSVAILRRMKYSLNIINYVKKLVRLHLRPMALVSDEVTDSAVRRLLVLAGNEFEDLMLLCRADITSKNPDKVKKHLNNYQIVMQKALIVEERDKLRTFKSPIDGNEIMKFFAIKPGPKIGKIKKVIENAILDGIIPNEHDKAFEFIKKNKKELLKL